MTDQTQHRVTQTQHKVIVVRHAAFKDNDDLRAAVRAPGTPVEYDVAIGGGLLHRTGKLLRARLGASSARVAVISNRRVLNLYGAALHTSLKRANFATLDILIGDGERYKTLRTAQRVLAVLAAEGFERGDVVLALGGGVTGDIAGFVAALHLRGLAFVNVPTTLLAQIDASIGGKTGVNTAHGKNLVGVFHHPHLVVIDTRVLKTLHKRDLVAGWCEAIKHGAAGDRALFDLTRDYLRRHAPASRLNPPLLTEDAKAIHDYELADLICRHVRFKAAIVSEDERESIVRTDKRSRRILNFGHTVAHALEAATNYRRFRHGEAVGRGMIAAAHISYQLGWLAQDQIELLCSAIGAAGKLHIAVDLDEKEIFARASSDKKSVGGSIQWVLLDSLGAARITDSRFVPAPIILRAIRLALDYDFRVQRFSAK